MMAMLEFSGFVPKLMADVGDAAAATLISGYFSIIGLIYCLALIIGLGSFVVWLWALVDCLGRKFKGENDKLLWVLVILFAGIIGSVIYYFLVKKKEG
ncbi:MAG: PLD nuclease N-terminal domain-containing protein [Candidatus Micrarchaeota archaeon]